MIGVMADIGISVGSLVVGAIGSRVVGFVGGLLAVEVGVVFTWSLIFYGLCLNYFTMITTYIHIICSCSEVKQKFWHDY